MIEYVIPLEQLSMQDVPRVGGKNASLGEMLQNLAPLGVRVPGGFATTADAYREFLAQDGLAGRIAKRLHELDVSDVHALQAAGGDIRRWIMEVSFPASMEAAIEQAYLQLEQEYSADVTWAVRYSATAEDLPEKGHTARRDVHEFMSTHPEHEGRERHQDTGDPECYRGAEAMEERFGKQNRRERADVDREVEPGEDFGEQTRIGLTELISKVGGHTGLDATRSDGDQP